LDLDKSLKSDVRIEQSVKKEKEKKHSLVKSIIPHKGHTIYEIDIKTLEITEAEYANVTYVWGGENKPEVMIKKGCAYVSALNKKSALKKYKKGDDGSKQVWDNPLKLNIF